MDSTAFEYDFAPGPIQFGRDVVQDIDRHLEDGGFERVIVVTGRNVGQNPTVSESLIESLGDRLVDWFDETTPEKSIETVYRGVDLMKEGDIDAIVGVGGGSSLDVATVMRLLHADHRSLDEVRAEVEETGTISLRASHDELASLTVIPTTFAGADLSTGAGINVPFDGGELRSASVIETQLMPDFLLYDPNLFESTPIDALAGSAMNGLNKGIEALYSRYSTPVTDGTASHGLSYLAASLPKLRSSPDASVMDEVVIGMILVQYGVSVPGRMKLAILHAFGHAFRDHGVQQGRGHAAITPEVLRFVFDKVDGRRELISSGLGLAETPGGVDDAIIDEVYHIRDSLELPRGVRYLDGVTRDDLWSLAERAHSDHCLSNSPEGLDPSVDELEAILREAW